MTASKPLTRYFGSMSSETITENETILRDFESYLDRLKASDTPYTRVKRGFMIALIEEKVVDARALVETCREGGPDA